MKQARSALIRCVGCSIAVLVTMAACGVPARAEDKTVAVFDGKDLKGWRSPTGDWRVVKGVIPDPSNPWKFAIADGQGVLINGRSGTTSNILSQYESTPAGSQANGRRLT